MPALTYRTADDLHVVDQAGAVVLEGYAVRYDGSPFAPGAFARSARERAHKVTAARHLDVRQRAPVGRPVAVEDRPEGLWLSFTLEDGRAEAGNCCSSGATPRARTAGGCGASAVPHKAAARPSASGGAAPA